MANMFPCATMIWNQECVLEPPNYEEKLHIYKSQVIIPYSIFEKTHALMGPMYDPYADRTSIKDFLPSYHRTKPLVSIVGPLNLEYMKTSLRVFRSAPPTKKNEDYILWLNKIGGKIVNSGRRKDKASTKPASDFTQTTPQVDNSPIHQPTPVSNIFEEVSKPTEVDDNISHHSTEQVKPASSASSMPNEGEGHHMDMDETYPRENFEQEEPKHLTPLGSP
ncbi:hypothetical protein KIW84_056871 [Lathyrus oleraceus]|uniref:Uncharacterized protein n=1 Tax=Pisum sativum TaxID=3888 RepID=A0A9D5AM04_PEA|nr:hypothetical protein KIW84_056871 [Pisum sativum]